MESEDNDMKRWITLMLAVMLLFGCAMAESYDDVVKYYFNTYGRWWDYAPELWLEYTAAVRAADLDDSHAAQAIAATDYILPPENAISYAEAAEIATQEAGGEAYPNIPCFMLGGRAVYKVLLREERSISATVELDAITGEVLGVYPAATAEAACFFVPNAIWEATATGYPTDLALTDDYTARYGTWWNWEPATFVEYSRELRRVREITGRTAHAMADTNYILPPEGSLSQAEMAALAIAAADAANLTYVNTLYFHVVTDGDDRYVCKVILSDGDHYSHAVELDPFTGDVLHTQTHISLEGPGQFLTPAILWEATDILDPNG